MKQEKKISKIKKTAKVPTKKKILKKPAKRIIKRKVLVKKFLKNPIISPKPKNSWEAWQTFNPGVVLLDDKVHLLYRAIGEDGVSRLGYAVSSDGFIVDERLPYPVFERMNSKTFNFYSYFSGGSFNGVEDPRLVQVKGEDNLYMTYTACDGGLRVGLTSIKIDDFLNKKWRWKETQLISPPGEVHKNWLVFPEKINGKYAILHSIKPSLQIEYRDNLEFNGKSFVKSFYGGGPQKGCWDKWLRGAGAPPIKTSEGWLLFYHAMDDDWSKYKVGAMLLDLNDPTKVLAKAKEPILSPSEKYENNGYKSGIIYVSGAVVKDGKLLIYYGCSDSFVGVAYANLNEFLEALKKGNKPKLGLKALKLKK